MSFNCKNKISNFRNQKWKDLLPADHTSENTKKTVLWAEGKWSQIVLQETQEKVESRKDKCAIGKEGHGGSLTCR